MILADTSVWIDHLRHGNAELSAALEGGDVLSHALVLGEIACGTIRNRREVLARIQRLPSPPVATDYEVLTFIESRALMGRGIGYIDAHLLASATLAGSTQLWTLDRRLDIVARGLGLAYRT